MGKLGEITRRRIKMQKHQIKTIFKSSSSDIKELAVFAEASKYIYKHFTSTVDAIKSEKLSKNLNYDIKIDDVVDLILNDTITTKLYENVIVRAYGILEVYIQTIADNLINSYPTFFVGQKEIKLSQLFEGDVEKLKQGIINESIAKYTSNKNMYEASINLLKPFNLEISNLKNYERTIKDIYALRNLIVHKNCIIDSKFLDNYSNSKDLKLGTRLIIEYKNMTATVNKITEFIREFNKVIMNKTWE
jgi:hypothetical protein